MAEKEPCIHEEVCIFYNCGSTSNLCDVCGHYLAESKVTTHNTDITKCAECLKKGFPTIDRALRNI